MLSDSKRFESIELLPLKLLEEIDNLFWAIHAYRPFRIESHQGTLSQLPHPSGRADEGFR